MLTAEEATGEGELPLKRGLEELRDFAATAAKLSLPYMNVAAMRTAFAYVEELVPEEVHLA